MRTLRALLASSPLWVASLAAAQVAGGLSCAESMPELPRIGINALFYDNGKRLCASVQADPAEFPCLRIGKVYVGQPRAEIERELGAPKQSLDGRDGRSSTQLYVVALDSVTEANYGVE